MRDCPLNKERVARQARVRQALVTCEHAVARLTLLTRLDILLQLLLRSVVDAAARCSKLLA